MLSTNEKIGLDISKKIDEKLSLNLNNINIISYLNNNNLKLSQQFT